jgi:hypothetical protein
MADNDDDRHGEGPIEARCWKDGMKELTKRCGAESLLAGNSSIAEAIDISSEVWGL